MRNIRRNGPAIALALGVFATSIVPTAAHAQASEERAGRLLGELTAAELNGRGRGTPGLKLAADRVRDEFALAGLEPGYRDSWAQATDAGDNIVGWIPGTGDEWVVVGAHYDGLGVGADGTEHAGEIFPGADDNASGVVALVQIARSLLERSGDHERSIVLVAFAGEETGLEGSRKFVEDPPLPLGKCVAMLNLDTIGRLGDGPLVVFGVGTAEEWEDVLTGVNFGFRFDLALNEGSGSASDHASFVAHGIPVLHFFTGAKPEYHRPTDVPELVDLAGVARIADFVAETVDYLAASPVVLTFRPEGVDRLAVAPRASTRARRVSLGTIPDFARESGGILLSGVMPDSPAAGAGLEKGDLITAIDGGSIDTMADFQAALAGHEPGDAIDVTFSRGEATKIVRVTLAERKH